MKKAIVVTFELGGIHCWPECEIEKVSYLKNRHRHSFHFLATKVVTDSDREIEIISFKNRIIATLNVEYYNPNTSELDFGTMSCEHIAEWMTEEFELDSCEVLEDGENGARVER